jgi:hypothetical protein
MLTENAQRRISLHGSSEHLCSSRRQSAAQPCQRPLPTFPVSLSRSARIERKVETAREWLDALAASARDVRRPLLRLALLRRDEALVDGILASLDAQRQRALAREHEARSSGAWARVAG